MRRVVDVLILLMVLGILGGVAWEYRNRSFYQLRLDTVRQNVQRIQQEIFLAGSMPEVEQTERGHPATVEPGWFGETVPDNVLFDHAAPWIEVAGSHEQHLRHPIERAATSPQLAKFWYNPYSGVVRARVPVWVSDDKMLEAYNFINDCHLPSLYAEEPRPQE